MNKKTLFETIDYLYRSDGDEDPHCANLRRMVKHNLAQQTPSAVERLMIQYLRKYVCCYPNTLDDIRSFLAWFDDLVDY